MHRTEGTNNVANLFVNGPPGTRLEENWLNSVQEEIIAVLTAAGIDPLTASTDTRVQLTAAIDSLINAGIVSLETFKTNIESSRLGSLNRSRFTYNGGAAAYTIKCKGASYYVKDKYAHWFTELTTGAIGAPGADDWYYLYLDYSAITSGVAITATELIWSATEPTWNDAYRAWMNGDDRCIFAVLCNSTPDNILEFFHEGNACFFANYRADLASTDIDTTWTDVTLTIPKFATQAICQFRMDYVDTTTSGVWRTNGQTGINGHTYGRVVAGSTLSLNTCLVHTDGSQIIEVKHVAAGQDKSQVDTEAWIFPIGL